MPADPDPESHATSRPWWTRSDPAWRSPWSLPDDGEELKVIGRAQSSPVVKPVASSVPSKSMETESTSEPKQHTVSRKLPPPTLDPPIGHDGLDDLRRGGSQRNRRRKGSRGKRKTSGSSASLVVMALAVLAFTFCAWLYVADEVLVNDDDLRIAGNEVDPREDASAPGRMLVFLNSLQRLLTADDMGDGPESWATDQLERIVDSNGQALDNLKDLLEEKEWQPRSPLWYQSDIGSHPYWGDAILLKQAEIALLERSGDEHSAFVAAVDLAELAKRMQELDCWPSFYTRSLDIHRRCMEAIANLLRHTELPADVLESLQKQVDACQLSDRALRDTLLPAFYVFEKKWLLGAESGEPVELIPNGAAATVKRQLFFKDHETLGIMASEFRSLIQQVGKPSASFLGFRGSGSAAHGLARFRPNGQGRLYALRRMDVYQDIPARQQMAKTRHLLVLQLFALRRFVAEHRGLPEKLGILVPRYLSELPMDPFSGQSFSYRPQESVIHSVGSDFAFRDGPLVNPSINDPEEPAVEIGVRPAPRTR